MCVKCFPDHIREEVYKAGFAAAQTGNVTSPFPVGAVLLADWNRGVNDGLDKLVPAKSLRLKGGKRTQRRRKNDC